jgi:hypothetical protein
MMRVCLLLLTLAIQDGLKPLPELQPFLAEVRKTLHTDNLLLSEYTYTEKDTSIQLDSDQKSKKTEVDVYQVLPESRDRPEYRRQIVKKGVPVTDKELEKQDADYQKKRNNKTPAEQEKARAKEQADDDKIIEDVFALYDIRIVGRERIADHPTIMVTFNPRSGYKPRTSEGKMMQHISGKAWISEDDYELARIEAEVIDTVSFGFGLLAKINKGTHLSAERHKFNDEIWLPARFEASISARVLLFKGFNMKAIFEYSDHKRFSVDTKLSFPELDKPVEP